MPETIIYLNTLQLESIKTKFWMIQDALAEMKATEEG